jgi:hypothetical protein
MILHDKTPDGRPLIQGEPEWFALRMGIPTASEFHRIVQPGGEPRFKKDGTPYKSHAGELAEGRWSYAFELVAERLLQESKETIDGLRYVERGKLLEADAVKHFEIVKRPLKTVKAGFITTDDGRWGCSPDSIVYDGDPPDLSMEEAIQTLGGIEIKVPMAAKHLEYFVDGPGTNYKCQVQGSLLITGFSHWWFESYHPGLPQALIRFERDEPFIEKMRAALEQFCKEVDEVEQKIRDAGYVPPPDHFKGPIEKYVETFGEDIPDWMRATELEGRIAEGGWGG